jgi:hypothetical protein
MSEVHDLILSTLVVITKHVDTQVNKGMEDLGLLMAKLIDYSNNVNQGNTNDMGTNAIVCILGMLHTLTNDSANSILKYCVIVVKVKMLTLHPNYVLCQGLLSSRSSM